MHTVELRSAPFWRFVHSCLPIGLRINSALRWALGHHEFFRIPWGRFKLTVPGAWIREATSASAPIYLGPVNQNPEFFTILAPRIASRSKGSIVDVGANLGAYTLNLRQLCDDPIIAFEPDPFMYGLLSENVRFNGLRDVSLRNVACGDAPGALRFMTGINGNVVGDDMQASAVAGESVITVPVVRLDDELASAGPISLLKIDCEGFEWHIIEGCRELIRKHRPLLFVELHPKLVGNFGNTLAQVCDQLRADYDLEFWDINPDQRSPSRAHRFAARYVSRAKRLRDEADMLRTAALQPGPDQLFMMATPQRSRPG